MLKNQRENTDDFINLRHLYNNMSIIKLSNAITFVSLHSIKTAERKFGMLMETTHVGVTLFK